MPFERARTAPTVERMTLSARNVADLANVVDMAAIRDARIKCGVDPLGGGSVAYWQAIADHYKLDLQVVNPTVDPRFAFMTVDHDGKIRMDCSSPLPWPSWLACAEATRLRLAMIRTPTGTGSWCRRAS